MKWNFPSVIGESKGINDTGVETFTDNLVSSLAREICQNSLDASVDNAIPVTVCFKEFKMLTSMIPDIAGLQHELDECIKFVSTMKSTATRTWLEHAKEILDSEYINVLRISDFNTTGLLGANQNNYSNPWNSLVRSTGVSDKNPTDGGSFGIGKFASFACSKLRTVFFSTNAQDKIQAYQGIARLPSSSPRENEVTTGFGFYGEANCTPIFEQLNFEKAWAREASEFGTDIYILGFSGNLEDPAEWKARIIASVLDGFLLSVYNNRLRIDVDSIIVDKDNLEELIEKYGEYGTNRSKEYYNVLTSSSTDWVVIEDFLNSRLGEVKIGILLDEGYHRKVAGIRSTGMMIQELDRFSSRVEFAGLLLLNGIGINRIMREMENPQHTRWNPSKLSENRTLGYQCYKALRDLIIETLNRLIEGDSKDFIDSDLGDFLPDISEDPIEEKQEVEAIKDEIQNATCIRKTSNYPKKPVKTDYPAEEDVQDPNGATTGNDDNFGAGHGDGKLSMHGPGYGEDDGVGGGASAHDTQKSQFGTIYFENERLICTDKKNGEYILFFTPKVSSSDARVEFFIASENRSADVPAKLIKREVAGQKSLIINGNRIENLTLIKGRLMRIPFKIDYKDFCSMEFKVYGNRN